MNIVRSAIQARLGRSSIILLCAAFLAAALVWAAPQRAQAAVSVDWYTLLGDIIVQLTIDVLDLAPQQPAFTNVLGQLQATVDSADQAHTAGDHTAEVSRISKAIGLAQALIGMTSSCSDCGPLRSDLQQIVGVASTIKSRALGAVTTCQPNGVIQGNEQCDPLAVPTGCPTSTVALIFCNDECLCQTASP